MPERREDMTTPGAGCVETPAPPCALVIFGASGDLTSRKLIPSLFRLYRRGMLPKRFFLVGCARAPMTDETFRERFRADLSSQSGSNPNTVTDFLNCCHFVSGDYHDESLYRSLSKRLGMLERTFDTGGNRLFYLATPPALYLSIVKTLAAQGMVGESSDGERWGRVVVEKPFGYDLASARELNSELHQYISERQTYRIDHYLGKDTVQNIFMLRFANAIFEPIWNGRHIDHVQITVAETIGVEHRAGYFEQAGLLRDMFQNHMLEMLALVAMEPPSHFEADRIRDEKVKLLGAIRPVPLDELDVRVVRGQYGPGSVEGHSVVGYRQEDGVRPESRTETFVAAKLMIDNWRWHGTPFYLRSGKRLARRVSEIAVTFKQVPHSVFGSLDSGDLNPNVLVLNVQPEEGMALTVQAKRPGPKLCMSDLTMSFRYADLADIVLGEAYERLLLDCMSGDQTLFIRFDGLEAAWRLIDPILNVWYDGLDRGELPTYPAGSWGPKQADDLLARDGRCWRRL